MANKKKIKILPLACILVLLIAAAGGYLIFRSIQKKNALQAAKDSLTIEVNEEMLNAEYGEPFDIGSFVKSHTGEMKTEGEVDSKKTGDTEIKVILSTVDSYNQTAEKEFTYTVHVSDTKKPVIVFKETALTITEGDEFDPETNIDSIKDPVDGDLKKADTLEKGTWTLQSDIDPAVPGEYTVTVKAMDANDNTEEASFTVTVEEQPYLDFEPVMGSADYPYYIRINRALNVVNIYTMDEQGYYSVPYKAMVCSTGDATPLGSYNTTAKYRWLSLYGGVYGQYATRIVGAILFHSVPYFTENPADLEFDEYNKLGTAASMGCVRLCVSDVLWIYENCPVGTTVEFYDDYEYPGPMGKPVPITIDTSDERRGWDPTDPDPDNPWN